MVRQRLENFNLPLRTRDVKTSRRARTDFLVARGYKDIIAHFTTGKEKANSGNVANGDCDALDSLMEKISALSLVPFVQGTMRYLYKTKKMTVFDPRRRLGSSGHLRPLFFHL